MSSTNSSWLWSPCQKQPKTLSFRASNHGNTIFVSTNPVFSDAAESAPESEAVTHSPEHHQTNHLEELETMIRGIKSSKRLLFDPMGATSSTIREADTINTDSEHHNQDNEPEDLPFGPSTRLVAMDSRDPLADFRGSMKEMIEAHGLRDWEELEELLSLYLEFNEKNTHGFIVAAFAGLFLGDYLLGTPSDSSSSSSSLHQDSQSCTSCPISSCRSSS